MKTNFKKAVKKYLPTLEQYVPIVARVHGESHPEFHDVHRVFNSINAKIMNSEEDLELNDEFYELRQITNDYEIPDDVCETFAAVYNMISELDRAYSL